MFGHIRRCLTLILSFAALASHAEERCPNAIATLVAMQGNVEWRTSALPSWQTAILRASFCPGDQIRVSQSATMRLSNETILRLNADALVTLGDAQPKFWIKLLRGAAYFLTRTPSPFYIEAPYVNAAIEGTEFVIAHTKAADTVTVFEGQVSGSNDNGQLEITGTEQLVARPDQAPTRLTEIDMLKQARWILYAPLILNVGSLPTELQKALYQGKYYSVFQTLKQAQSYDTNLAALALYFGDTPLVDRIIQKLPTDEPSYQALALIQALSLNDMTSAQALANKTTNILPASAALYSARSYFWQASTNLPKALEDALNAARLEPSNPFVHLRVAELSLSLTDQRQAKNAINQSLQYGTLPRVYLFKGILALQRGYARKARQAFTMALNLNGSDPLTHFVSGLTQIQQRQTASGRAAIETAVALDPSNSLFRSYLAKAYAAEKRAEKAETQLALAKQLDLDDPTPWLYQALMEQNQQRYIPALRAHTESLKRNDGRAVQRSRLQLDTDAAIKHANLANIYLRLGLASQAQQVANQALQTTPTDYSNHKLLADTLNLGLRQDRAASSEFLQAQIRQPVQTPPLNPLRAEQNLILNQDFAPYQIGLTEYSNLFNTTGIRGHISLGTGSQDTQNQSVLLNGSMERLAGAVSYYNFTTDGDTSDFARDYQLASLHLKGQITPGFNLMLSGSSTKTDQSLVNNISTDNIEGLYSQTKLLRMGLHHHRNPRQEWLFVIDKKTDDSDKFEENSIIPPDITFTNTSSTKDDVWAGEFQTTGFHQNSNSTFGFRRGKINRIQQRRAEVSGTPIVQAPFLQNNDSNVELKRVYMYVQSQFFNRLDLDTGLSYTAFEDEAIMMDEEKDWQIKLGASFQATPALNIRAAYFEQLQAPNELSQSLEPTQIGGFNQLYDDANYIRSNNIGLGFNLIINNNLYWLTQGVHRTLDWSDLLDLNTTLQNPEIEENLAQSEWVWLASDKVSYRVALIAEEQSYSNGNVPTNLPSLIRTQTMSHRVFCSLIDPLTLAFEVDWVRQKTDFLPAADMSLSRKSIFWVSNLNLRYRFTRNLWELSLQGRNLANERFDFQDASIIDGQKRSLRYLPERNIALTISTQF